jgi:hypothetical protein
VTDESRGLTLKRQGQGAAPGSAGQVEQSTARLLSALEETWAAIARRHPELPAAVVVVGPGSDRRQGLFKWGHFAAFRWRPRDGTKARLPEVLVAGEGLERSAAEVTTTLLHEAAHAIAHVRGVQDTSRDGRYHNRLYQQIANEVGLDVEDMPPYGKAKTTLRPETEGLYASEIERLQGELVLYRVADQADRRGTGAGGTGAGRDDGAEGSDEDGPSRTRDRNLIPASCSCGRRLRIAASTLAAGPVLCGLCGAEFETSREAELPSRGRPEREDLEAER